ncbi:LysR family transcriptional regulator [Microbacterium betulae]|uniref:LysR family transcriptional regulator n=1 Tax=Microbacterium betulae TaxID=2981139 RepID=A0AA97FIT7_9MICO|nr:LysR family transcriptional regulator [Microbacterium sp. AB]WOF24038.1 LysR family transcriptional regulator [Microbacterium sp. AB]
MSINPSRLPFLLAIARHGGVLAAAEALHVTPSAVSQQLARLEDEVGRPLVERTPRGTTMTGAGRELVELAENVEREVNEAEQRLVAGDADPRGRVRIGGFQSFFCAVLVPALPRWRNELFHVEVDLREGTRAQLLRSLRAAELDVVVVEYDASEPVPALGSGVHEVPLMDDPWKLVVPAGTVAAGEVVELERLRAPWLGVESSAATLDAVRRVRTSLRGSTSAHTYGEYATALALVAAGEGVTLLPSLALQGPLPDGVDVVDVPGLGARRLAVRHRSNRREPGPAVRAAVGFLRDVSAAFQASQGS